MGHGVEGRTTPAAAIDSGLAKTVAETMQALATPSRLLIMARLRQSPCAVNELAEAIGMQRSAVSHQLRYLRHLDLVTGDRRGRSIIYRLYDDHVAALLDEAVYHVEHRRLGVVDPAGAESTG
jgi:DNA-binding transcriptional ArsR family regulator